MLQWLRNRFTTPEKPAVAMAPVSETRPTRAALALGVTVMADSQAFSCRSTSVSRRDIHLITEHPPSVGTWVTLYLGANDELELRGRVRAHQDEAGAVSGCVVQFVRTSAEVQWSLDELLYAQQQKMAA